MTAATVEVREVSLRDGLQDLPHVLSTEVKQQMLRLLHDGGLRRLEVTSMVPASLLPQFGDAEALLGDAGTLPAVHRAAFTPNARGVERALAAGVEEVALAVGATDALNEANFRAGIATVLQRIEQAVAVARDGGCAVSITVGGAFGCPFEGPVDPQAVREVARRVAALGPDLLMLGDTTGMADPALVGATASAVVDGLDAQAVGVHLHGGLRAVPGVVAAADAGVASVDSSMNGLGGCPFVPSAPGNTPTVAVVAALEDAGHATGLDVARLRDADDRIAALLAAATDEPEAVA